MYYRQPRYFEKFYCLGDKCKNNCCYGWRISWRTEEVGKVKNAEGCSSELRELIERSFVLEAPANEKYRVMFDERGKCPCVTEEGLCRIQKELGAEYLSSTCMVYPRCYSVIDDNTILGFLNTSCEEVQRLVIENENSMELIDTPFSEPENVKINYITDKSHYEKHPELKYHKELFDFFYEIIGNRDHNVETNIILGALAAQQLAKLVESGAAHRIPDAVEQLKQQMFNEAQLQRIEEISPNYNVKLAVLSECCAEALKIRITDLLKDETGAFNIDIYDHAEGRLKEKYKDKPFWLKNIALNLMLEHVVPFFNIERSIYENYAEFALVFAVYKLCAVAASVSDEVGFAVQNQKFHFDDDNRVIGVTSVIGRRLNHEPAASAALLDSLKKRNMISPAYIALMLK